MRIAIILTGAVVVSLTVVTAQDPQNFSGHWVAIEPQSVAGQELRIAQDTDTLTIEQVRMESRQTFDSFGRRLGERPGAVERTTYRLDGKDTIITIQGAGEPQQVRSSARWEKNRLVLSEVYPATRLRFQRTIGLDRKGRLVFETRRPASGNEPIAAAENMLAPERIVYEKR